MNDAAVFLIKLAKYALIIALVITLIGHFTQTHGYGEQISEIWEKKAKHLENSSHHSESDCEYCEQYNEAKAELNRSRTNIWMNTLKTILTFVISCGILYGVGEAVGYLGLITDNTHKERPPRT